MKSLSALIAGLVFGIGLIVSGMSNPAKVVGFLDLAGNWDPSLAFVMGGAIAVGLVTFRFAKTRTLSLLGEPMALPTNTTIDKRLVLGSLIFGIGWGIAGFCPGPSLVAFGMGYSEAVIFVVSMIVGMGVFAFLERPKS
jgi:uncharacterized membrane protein YedE/YeeE